MDCFCGLTWTERKMKLCLAGLLIVITAGMFCGFAGAEEGGGGHYLPGATPSFIDMLLDCQCRTNLSPFCRLQDVPRLTKSVSLSRFVSP